MSRPGSWRTSARCAVVRGGAWKDDGFARSYRRQAAELGWYSMLVPEELGGGSMSGNGVLDAALIAYERGRSAAAGLVRRHERGRRTRWPSAGGDEPARWCCRRSCRARPPASWAARSRRLGGPDGGYREPSDGSGYELSARQRGAGRRRLVVVPRHVRHVRRPGAGARRRRRARGHVAGWTHSTSPVRFARGSLRRACTWPAAAVVGVSGAADLPARQLALASRSSPPNRSARWTTTSTMTVQYAKDRIAFGRPIGSFQAVKHQFADTSLRSR